MSTALVRAGNKPILWRVQAAKVRLHSQMAKAKARLIPRWVKVGRARAITGSPIGGATRIYSCQQRTQVCHFGSKLLRVLPLPNLSQYFKYREHGFGAGSAFHRALAKTSWVRLSSNSVRRVFEHLTKFGLAVLAKCWLLLRKVFQICIWALFALLL